MKRLTTLLLLFSILLSLNTVSYASSDVKIKVNGTLLSDAQAILKDGSTLLPVRSVSTALGGKVVWDTDTKTASIDKDRTAVAITIGQKEITINGKTKAISTPAQIVNGRTYVPLRALGEALECDITWVKETKTVEITQQDPSEYKAWYAVGEDGLLYIHTNINSDKWGGYSFVCRYVHPDGDDTWNTLTGKSGIVTYQTFSSVSHYDIGETIKHTEVYIFKGTDSLQTFRRLHDVTYSKSRDKWEKSAAAMGDLLVCKFTLNNKIHVKESNMPIHITDFNMTYDRPNQKEIYTIYIGEEISKTGEYGIVYRTSKDSVGSSLKQEDGHLTASREIYRMSSAGSSGKVYITYGTFTMEPDGTIICHKTESDRIDYTIPAF